MGVDVKKGVAKICKRGAKIERIHREGIVETLVPAVCRFQR